MTLSILSADMTESTATVTATEATLKTYPMSENYSKWVKVEAQVNVSTTPASVAQPLTFRLKIGNSNSRTYVLQSLSETDSEREQLIHVAELRARENILVTIQGVIDDANTSVACEFMIIYIDV